MTLVLLKVVDFWVTVAVNEITVKQGKYRGPFQADMLYAVLPLMDHFVEEVQLSENFPC